MSIFYFGNIFVNFHSISQLLKESTWQLLLASFVLADDGNFGPNFMKADDASMQQCAVAHCARPADGSVVDLLGDIGINWCGVRTHDQLRRRYFEHRLYCAVVLFHLLAWTSSKITNLHLLCTNTAANMTKVVIKILHGIVQLHKPCKVG